MSMSLLAILIIILTLSLWKYSQTLNNVTDFMLKNKSEITEIKKIQDNFEESINKLGAKPLILTVTAYSPRSNETDDTPYETAFPTRVKPWTIAVSRDLFNYGWTGGKYAYIEGLGPMIINIKPLDMYIKPNQDVVKINDLMAKSRKDGTLQEMHIDIFFDDTEFAFEFGTRTLRVWLLHLETDL